MSISSLNPSRASDDASLQVRRIGGRLGAVIEGVRLSDDLDEETVGQIRTALHRHKVVFFRGQTHLDDDAQERFAALLGTPETHPTVPARDGTQHVFELDSQRGERANVWHTDVTFRPAIPYAGVLRGETIPEYGGDTLWANTVTAYLDLPDTLRERVDGLWSVHTNDYDYLSRWRRDQSESPEERKRSLESRKQFSATTLEAEHPVVHVLPGGERALLLGGFLRTFIGIDAEESAALYAKLQSYVTRPENTVRWHWTQGDVAIWDNRTTQHYAANDYDQQRRVVRRVSLAGEAPIALDGRRSVQRAL